MTAVLVILATGVLAGAGRALLIVPLHVPLDPNEGWNAYHAAAAMAGSPYPPASSFTINNYPPLSFYIVGIIGSWLGDNVLAGRFVSLAAFACLCLFVVIALRRLGAHWSGAVFAALLLADVLLLNSDYVGMDDPQLLGHALQFAGLLMLIPRPQGSTGVIVSAALFMVGGFVKHNLVALPLASLLWLVLVDRRKAASFAGALLVLSIAGLIATDSLLNVNLFRELNSPRDFSAVRLARNFADWLTVAAVPLCGLTWLVWWCGKHEATWLVSLYAAIAIVIGTILFGGEGVDVNVMFDADLALALCAGLIVSRSVGRGTRNSLAAAQAFAALCILPAGITALRSPEWRDVSFWLRPMREEATMAGRDIAFLRTHAGAAMCQDMTFCYWAGKSALVDVFNLDQQFKTGVRDPAPFLRMIRAHYFAAVELDQMNPFPFPRNVQTIFRGNYRVDHENDDGIFFIPR